MKFRVKTQSGSRESEHELDLPGDPCSSSDTSRCAFSLDGQSGAVDWVEVSPGVYSIILEGRSYEVCMLTDPDRVRVGEAFEVSIGRRAFRVEVQDLGMRRAGRTAALHDGPQEILAPMPARVVRILVEEGAGVASGQGLLVIEAMKMQNEVRAPRSGRVEKIHVREGKGVEAGAKLVRLA